MSKSKEKPSYDESVSQLESDISAVAIATVGREHEGPEIFSKGPKRSGDKPANKPPVRRTNPGPGTPSQLQASRLQLLSEFVRQGTPTTAVDIWQPLSQPPPPPPPPPLLQPNDDSIPDSDSNADRFLEELLSGCLAQNPAGVDTVVFTTPFTSDPQPQFVGQPPPQSAAVQSVATVSINKPGPPVSEETRVRLINHLNPLARLVDENFNTPLHNAIAQERSAEVMDYLLSDLKEKKKLLSIIHLLNSKGHTPLSLSLKMHRPDLVALLLRYDAVPTQLCGSAVERTNHFHYAMSKCLATSESLHMVHAFIDAVCRQCHSDLTGLLAKNRNGKTAMDYLEYRISELARHQDPASAELLTGLRYLRGHIHRLLEIVY